MATQLAEDTQFGAERATLSVVAGEEQTEARDYEYEARAQGWKPPEEYKGNASAALTAEEFVKRGEEMGPILKAQNRELLKKLDMLERKMKKVEKSEQRAYENALASLRAQQEEAVETGDIAAHREISKQLDTLKDEIKADGADLVGGENPAEQWEAFVEGNSWYEKADLASASETEIEARLFADRLMKKWAREGKDNEMIPSDFFAAVTKEVDAKFPQLKAKALRPKPASAVAGVTRAGLGGKTQTGANLPADARTQATRFHAQGVYGKKTLAEALDAYARSYDWNS